MQRSAGHAVPGAARPDRPEGPGFPILEAANSLMSFFQAKLEQWEIVCSSFTRVTLSKSQTFPPQDDWGQSSCSCHCSQTAALMGTADVM